MVWALIITLQLITLTSDASKINKQPVKLWFVSFHPIRLAAARARGTHFSAYTILYLFTNVVNNINRCICVCVYIHIYIYMHISYTYIYIYMLNIGIYTKQKLLKLLYNCVLHCRIKSVFFKNTVYTNVMDVWMRGAGRPGRLAGLWPLLRPLCGALRQRPRRGGPRPAGGVGCGPLPGYVRTYVRAPTPTHDTQFREGTVTYIVTLFFLTSKSVKCSLYQS